MATVMGPREQARRHRELRSWIGRQVTELRTETGATIAELARCAGIDPAHAWRIEAGRANASLEVLVALAGCLGSDVGVRLFAAANPRIHDRFQAPMVEALIKALGAPWRAQPEVPVPAARGVIDLVLRRPADHCVLACECHSELRRLDLVVRRAMEKAEALRTASDPAEQGDVFPMLLIRSTEATRAVARAYEATLAAAFPARSRDALEALAGTAPWPGPALVWAGIKGGRATILDGPPRGIRVGR